MTYNAVENYLRKFRKEAMTMKAQAEGRQAAAPSPARPRTKKAGDFSPVKGEWYNMVVMMDVLLTSGRR